MQDWMLPRITDYWDQQVQAIDRLSRALKAVPSSDNLAKMALLRAAIVRHVGLLTDQDLIMAAVAIADDLYKAADYSAMKRRFQEATFVLICPSCCILSSARSRWAVINWRCFSLRPTARGPGVLWPGPRQTHHRCLG
jgi:hypothetical protein